TYGGGASDVANELKIAKEAKKYGMKVLLDFHYSDFWADPTYQILPKAWKSDSQSELNEDVYSFTKTTVQRFKQAGVDVGMVQIGNEITKGMMGVKSNDYRAVWGDPVKSKKLTTFLSYASKGVRESAPNALVAVHIETPDPEKYGFIMDTLQKNGVDYDVLGSSYYPFYSRTANTPQMLAKVEALAANYGKYFAVMETSWVNTLQDADGTPNSIGDGRNVSAYDVSPQGQTNELTDLYKALGSQPNGLGAFYWEPAWIPVKAGWKNWEYNKQVADQFGTGWASKGAVGYYPNNKMYYNGKPAWGGSSWDNHGLFDDLGQPLQSLLTYKNMIGNGDVQTTRLRFVDENG
ncbi:glycosyl hydrolase 53 family protein, partial [Weissella cibaria]